MFRSTSQVTSTPVTSVVFVSVVLSNKVSTVTTIFLWPKVSSFSCQTKISKMLWVVFGTIAWRVWKTLISNLFCCIITVQGRPVSHIIQQSSSNACRYLFGGGNVLWMVGPNNKRGKEEESCKLWPMWDSIQSVSWGKTYCCVLTGPRDVECKQNYVYEYQTPQGTFKSIKWPRQDSLIIANGCFQNDQP